MLKALAAGAVAGLFVLSTAAVAAGSQGALAPGKAATVKQAQWVMVNGQWVWLVGGGLVVGGLAAVLSGNGNGGVGSTTTCAPSGCTSTSTTTSTTTTP